MDVRRHGMVYCRDNWPSDCVGDWLTDLENGV